MTTAEPTAKRRSLSLAGKLGAVLLAVGAGTLAALLAYLVPRTTAAFTTRSQALIDDSGRALRNLSARDTDDSRAVLVDLIQHSTEARRRALDDLPLSLYGGDVERIRAAVAREDDARRERLRDNVERLTREMQRRAAVRIDAHVGELTRQQQATAAAFADDLAHSLLWLSAALFALLLALLGLGLVRLVVLPVRRLRDATQAVTRGDLGVDVRVRSADEVGALSADFATMVRQLQESRDEIRRQHEELQQWNRTLGVEVERKTAHLERALRRLRATQTRLLHAEKMASLGTLAGGIAHEFNNLIGGIRGCAADALSDVDDPGEREPLEVILRAADRAAAITDQMLRFARLRVGAMQPTALAAVLAEVLRLLEPQLRAAGVRVDQRLAPLPEISADAAGLHQVLLNLLRNAIQAMPAGGTIEVTGSVDGEDVVLAVRDEGTGIAPDQLEHVFDPFYTSKDREADPDRRGSGLGLAVSYGIVEAHGGRIEVQSRLGTGTTFSVRLPIDGAIHDD